MRRISLRFRRTLAMLCAVVTLLSSLGITSVSADSADINTAYIALDGKKVSAITLPQNGKLQLQVKGITGQLGYGWQIRDPERSDYWVDITGANSDCLSVTYALVGSMLKDNGNAWIRCRISQGNVIGYTDSVKVTVSFNPKEDPNVQPMILQGSRPMREIPKRAATEEEFKTHSIVINYLFDNNALAFEPYGATVERGGDFYEKVTSPTVVGYKPVRRVGETYEDADVVILDLKNIQEDVVINIVYEPTLVKFSVHHHLQNLYDDDYALNANFITNSMAVTGTVVGDGLAMTEAELPGFRALAYEKLPVAADGSTIIEIRYDRNYYLVDFDMNGGYGTEPVYTRYGAAVGANTPIRHGYVFDGWELVSYDGRTPTATEAAQFNITGNSTITVPAANLRYRARWITAQTTYTMVFWKENAEDNGYSYWGYLDKISAMSGSIVDAQDWASRAKDIDDEAYFTFNSAKSDKNVLVEGDGTTVVNVYYTRNYYKITFKAKAKCAIPEKHTHGDECYDMICGGYHEHSDDCLKELVCKTLEHAEHTAACVKCGMEAHTHGQGSCPCTLEEHTHSKSCWSNVGAQQTNIWNFPTNKEDGYIHKSGRYYYIYIQGSWYRYTGVGAYDKDVVDRTCKKTEHIHGVVNCGCTMTEHAHVDSCYRDVIHAHEEGCYRYGCGQVAHVHSDSCKRLKCGITTGHTHNNDCKSTTKTNTVKIAYYKYEQSLKNLWPVVDGNGRTYNKGERWTPTDSSYYSQVLVYLSNMPPDDFTLTLSEVSYDTFIMHYNLEELPAYDGAPKTYKESHVVSANYNYLTYEEDFYEIKGFVRSSSSKAFTNGQLDIPGGGDVYFYYDRGTDNPLTFNNNGTIVTDRTVEKVMYEAPLKKYNFVPDYPSNLEPGAYAFAGWYTSPGCFAGTEVNWDTIIMEDGGLQLFAKWAPITHRVRVFKDATMKDQIGIDQIVAHQAFAHAPDGNVTNGNYVFQGWFYKDSNGVEKAFVFTGIPVTQDLDIYAKWSSHIQVEYKIEYKLHLTGETIADPTVGSTIAGNNKTFTAKAGDELYKDFQSGYYPLTNSHTITMSADGNHTFTFYYVYVENMPYKVRYVDAVTGAELATTKYVMDNTLSVVTETFVRVDGMMPDAYQKRLVLVAGGYDAFQNPTGTIAGEDADNDGVLDNNEITFYYTSDTEHAYYRVVHYIQNINGDGYREYRSQEMVGEIGTSYTIDALTLTGFAFAPKLTVINGTVKPGSGNKVTAKLGAEGLLVELYYTRENVPYVVRYLDSTTGNEIYPSYTGSGVFGQLVAEYAVDLTNLGYELIGEQAKTLTLSANTEYNLIEFKYQEKTISLKYQIIGPDGSGSLSRTSENVQAITGVANGSVPMVTEGHAFKGWFLDEACTIAVPAEWVSEADKKLTPVKTADVWQDVTYYAKFVALVTDLTIQVVGTDDWDAQQSYLFRIKGKDGTKTEGIDLTVAVLGNSSVTVTKVPIGEYTVTELSAWAWRYNCEEDEQTLVLEYSDTGNTLVFVENRDQGLWLDGYAANHNLFKNAE